MSAKRSASSRRVWSGGLCLGACAGLATAFAVGLGSCSGKVTGTSAPVLPVFGNVIPLTAADVNLILTRATQATNSPNLYVAVVDRTGEILGAWSTASASFQDEDNIAISLARTTAYFSNSQAPLSSRTVETLSTFHFPPTFDPPFLASAVPTSGGTLGPVIAPTRTTTGIPGTPQGPLWQINSTNRGADIATLSTTPATSYNTSAQFDFATFDPSRNINGSFPSPGITLLPGAVPLYKRNSTGVPRLVGGIGCFVRESLVVNPDAVPDVEAAEYAAIIGATGTGAAGDENFFLAIEPEGAITIGGILLPYVKQTTLPPSVGAGPPAQVFPAAITAGKLDPFGFLIGPRDGIDGGPTQVLTQADVELIIDQVIDSANITRAQVRLPLGSGAKVIATVVDTRGLILAHFRMEDTLCDAVDVVPAKARSVVYFCRPGGPFSAATNRTLANGNTLSFPFGDAWQGFPVDPTGQNRGIALTTRTLGFLSQPFYPPGIEGTGPGPLFNLARLNQETVQVDRWGNAPPDPGYQNGLTFFPGSVPLYKGGELVGALGVSGDG
ncbi:MAG TPA: hypothetical protein VF384_12910, partial [Planctomycetota bacterium]